jgi:hypothetical protein
MDTQLSEFTAEELKYAIKVMAGKQKRQASRIARLQEIFGMDVNTSAPVIKANKKLEMASLWLVRLKMALAIIEVQDRVKSN